MKVGQVVIVTAGDDPPAGTKLFVQAVGKMSASLWMYGRVWISVSLENLAPLNVSDARPFILSQGKVAHESSSALHREAGRLYARHATLARAYGEDSVIAGGALMDLCDEIAGPR